MYKTFDDKLFEILKTNKTLTQEKHYRTITDELYPVGARIRDTSSNVKFSKGTWVLNGVYGTAMKTINYGFDENRGFNIMFYFIGKSVIVTVYFFKTSDVDTASIDLNDYLGNTSIECVVGQASSTDSTYNFFNESNNPYTITCGTSKIDINATGLSQPTKKTFTFTVLCSMLDFDGISKLQDMYSNNVTYEFQRTA